MILQVTNGMFVVVEDGNVTKELPISISETIIAYEHYPLVLDASIQESKQLVPYGLKNVKGILINADGRVQVVNGTELKVEGKNIYLNHVNVGDFTVKALDKLLDEGDIEVLEVEELESINRCKITAVDENYTYSKLISLPVMEPFALENMVFMLSISNHTTVVVQLVGIRTIGADGQPLVEPLPTETGDAVAYTFERIYNGIVGRDLIEVIYNAISHCFEIICLDYGSFNIQFEIDEFDNRLRMGMDSPTLKLGGDDWMGKKLEFLSGTAIGDSYTIYDIEGDTIWLETIADPVPAVGDKFRIYDDACKISVKTMVFE